MNKAFRSLITVIISAIIWLTIFESFSGYWIRRWGDPLDKAKEILVLDRFFGWHQKENFNGKFLDIPLKTNELGLRNKSFSEIEKSSKNILIMGPSSTFGWGVEKHQTYSFLLEESLKKQYPGIKINVINAGQVGFSSWQGLEFYKKKRLEELKADVLIIAYGANDIDRFRFFYNSRLPDKEEFAVPKNACLVFLQNILTRSNFINLFSRKMFNLLGNFKCIQRDVPTKRVGDADFATNIEELIGLGKLNGSEVILLTTAYELPLFNSVSPEIKDIFLEYFNAGKNKYEKKQYREALALFKKSIEINPEQNEVYYYLSSCYSYLGNRLKKQEMFEKARRSESKRIAEDLDKLNNLTKEIAEKNGIILFDLKRCLALVKDSGMFIDPIHTSERGNKEIAANLSDVIYEYDLLKISKKGN